MEYKKLPFSGKFIRTIFKYDSKTGFLIWKIRPSQMVKIGAIAGTVTHNGYRKLGFRNRRFLEHRIVWLYHYNECPKYLDHINGNRADNRIKNLRLTTQRHNLQNMKCHRNGHLVGTTFHKKEKRWRAQIHINGRKIVLGRFNTQLEAHNKYLDACKG